MIEVLRVILCLVLPAITGALLISCCWRGSGWHYRFALIGMAFQVGMVGVICGYVLLDRSGVGLSFGWNLTLQLGLAAMLACVAAWRWRQSNSGTELHSFPVSGWGELSPGLRLVVIAVVAWLVLRLLGILLEVLVRPLYPWDAWYAYGMQAKAWFYYPELGAIKNGWPWFASIDPALTAGGTRHPPGIGLMQLWMLQSFGRYDDALMNLPWPLAMASIGLALFGILRIIGVGLLFSLGAVTVLMTLPVVNTQAVLAGYGDLWIGLYLLLALSGFVLARRHGYGCYGITLVGIAGMLSIKETAWLWAPVLAAGILASYVRLRWLFLTGLIGVAGFIAFLWWRDEPMRVSTLGRLGFADGDWVFPSKIGLQVSQEVTMWPALLQHLFVYDNWHLFWYLVPIFSIMALWYARMDRALLSVVITALGGLAVLIGFFAFSSMGEAVISGTSVNRLLLHLVPAFVLMAAMVSTLWTRVSTKLQRSHEA